MAEIAQLSSMEKGCFAGNGHFAKLLGVKKTAISRTISSLEKKGFITSEITPGSRNKERVITINKMLSGDNKMLSQPITKCLETKGNNTSINNTVNKKNTKKVFKKPSVEELKSYCQEKCLSVDCEYFFYHYEANGWKVGKAPMRDWKATLKNWHRRQGKFKTGTSQKQIKDKEFKSSPPPEWAL